MTLMSGSKRRARRNIVKSRLKRNPKHYAYPNVCRLFPLSTGAIILWPFQQVTACIEPKHLIDLTYGVSPWGETVSVSHVAIRGKNGVVSHAKRGIMYFLYLLLLIISNTMKPKIIFTRKSKRTNLHLFVTLLSLFSLSKKIR